MNLRSLPGLAGLALLLAGPSSGLPIAGSKHDLTAGGNVTTPEAVSENDVCKFCHAAHKPGVNVPLWNKEDTAETFTYYSSRYVNTYLGFPVKPDSVLPSTVSKRCMSCHDGVTAVGAIYSGPDIAMTGTGKIPAGSGANLGVTFADDHPVLYDITAGNAIADGLINNPPTAPVTVNSSNEIECTSCHDPHDNANSYFLVATPNGGTLCLACHVMSDWTASSIHRTSNQAYPGEDGSNTYSTVAAWGCLGCHRMHNVPAGSLHLLRQPEEAACYLCHGSGGQISVDNVQTMIEAGGNTKHPLATSGKHINTEYYDSADPTAQFEGAQRHAECQDCHNPHAAEQRVAKVSPDNTITGALLGAWGVEPAFGAKGTFPTYTARKFTALTDREPWLCMKCHSSYISMTGTIDVCSTEFNPSNDSFHPVFQPLPNTGTRRVPAGSLIGGFTPGGTMMCSDCHGYPAPPPYGPHASTQVSLLRASLVTTNDPTYGVASTPLCLACHNPAYYVGTTAGSLYDQHPGVKAGHVEPQGCLLCHGWPAKSGKGAFHGLNFAMPGSGNRGKFMNNNTYFTEWIPSNGTPGSGSCTTAKSGGNCKAHTQPY